MHCEKRDEDGWQEEKGELLVEICLASPVWLLEGGLALLGLIFLYFFFSSV